MQLNRREFFKTAGIVGAGLSTGMIPSFITDALAATFKTYVMIPNNQPARMVWGTLSAAQMEKLGIEVESMYVPWSIIIPRRTTGKGKPHAQGGWDIYFERYYYNTIVPHPETLFQSNKIPPNGPNYYYIEFPELDKTLERYTTAKTSEEHMAAIIEFQKWWYENEPMIILFYPEDVIAINPKLKGFDSTTFNPVFYPRPENWIIEGAGDKATATFAEYPEPTGLLPMYTSGYSQSNIFGPVHNCLLEYDNWQNKKLIPALAESYSVSEDGLTWTINLRQGVRWHSGWPFTAHDVRFTWDVILDERYSSEYNATLKQIMGSPEAYKVTGEYQITVTLPQYSSLFLEWVMGAIAIMPEHAYKDIPPESLRGHPANTWLDTYKVKQPNGGEFVAYGAIGTGPWIPQGYDPTRKAYKMVKNHDYWKPTSGNVETYYTVIISGSDAVLSALKAGEVDAMDPMYSIENLVPTIKPEWGKVLTFDSYKWQHLCFNLRHPVFGTGEATPLGKQDPAKAREAARYVRKAISHAIPRAKIVEQIVSGYGKEGTVPIPYTAPEYQHELLKPIVYDMSLAKEYMRKAGYSV